MRFDYDHEKFMKKAMLQAKKAASIGEVPIGCVIVKDGEIIARGYNKRKKDKNTLSHAELTAIDKACKKTGIFEGIIAGRAIYEGRFTVSEAISVLKGE